MNVENIKCCICQNDFEISEIVELKCKHTYCLACFETYLKDNLNYQIKCPYYDCPDLVSENQIRSILDNDSTELYDKICLDRIGNIHCCLLDGCNRQISFEDNDIQYECECCTLFNCIKCRAAHASVTCAQYISMLPSDGMELCENELKRAAHILHEKNAVKCRESIEKASRNVFNPNTHIFNCTVCAKLISKGMGVLLKNCLDNICKECLRNYIKSSSTKAVCCPICGQTIDDSECRGLLTEEELIKYEDRMLEMALPEALYCQHPDCRYAVEIPNKLKKWKCKVCNNFNCVKCGTIHRGESCRQFIINQRNPSKPCVQNLIKDKKLMECPFCKQLLQKISGCRKITCSACKSDLCWNCQTYRKPPLQTSNSHMPVDKISMCTCLFNNLSNRNRCLLL